MIPWIQVYSNLPQHPKTSKLADELGLSSAALNPNALAVGMLVSLWTWAIQNAYNGDLSGCSARAIAEACLWKKKPETLVKALQTAGFLDSSMKLHDWEEYACLIMEQEEARKAKNRERVRKHREAKAPTDDAPVTPCNAPAEGTCNALCNVTETPCNAPTIPNHTIPDITITLSGGDGDARAQARESVGEYARGRDLDPSAYFGVSEAVTLYVAAFTDELFRAFSLDVPTDADRANVFRRICAQQWDGQKFSMTVDDDRKSLLMYAFEQANNSRKPGDWNYIDGILARLAQRGIKTLDAAEKYDMERR